MSLCACGETASRTPSIDTLVVGTPLDITTVNPLIATTSGFNGEILRTLFPGLLEEQPDFSDGPPTFAPLLAESYAFSDDRRTLTFKLRQGLRWSDGEPLTAEDVRWTWEAQRHPEVAWDYAFAKERIDSVEVVDPLTIRYHFSEVYYAQLLDANEGGVLPRHVWSRLPFGEWRRRPEWFRENLVSGGAYSLEAWKPQQQIELSRNPQYFAQAATERVVFRVIPDPARFVQQMLDGELHVAPGIQQRDISRFAGRSDIELHRLPTRTYAFISWNTRRPPFDDPEVRRALTLCIDRQELIDTLLGGEGAIADSPVPTTVWAHAADLEPWPFAPEEGRAVLAAAGWTDSDGDGVLDRDGTDFRFQLSTNSEDSTKSDAVVLIQAQLARAGVEVVPRIAEYATLSAANHAHDYDATLALVAIDTSLDLEPFFHSSAIDGGYNWGSYRNAEVDRLIMEVNAQTATEEVASRLHRIQHILHREQPLTFLWQPYRTVALDRRVRDAQPNALGDFFHLRQWRLAP